LRHCCDFSAASSDSAPGALCPPRYAPGVTLRDKVRSCEIRTSLNVELLYSECPMTDWRGKPCWLNPRVSDPDVVQGLGGVTASPTLFGPVLVWSKQNYLKLLLTVRFSKFYGCCPHNHPREKSDMKMNNIYVSLFTDV